MRSTWVKIVGALLLPCLMVAAYASEPENDPTLWDDEQYFEYAYTSCLTRYQGSKLAHRKIHCVCEKLARYALEWRQQRDVGGPLPAAPQNVYRECYRQ